MVTAEVTTGMLVPASGDGTAAPLRQRYLHNCAFGPDGTVATAADNHRFGDKPVMTLWDPAGRRQPSTSTGSSTAWRSARPGGRCPSAASAAPSCGTSRRPGSGTSSAGEHGPGPGLQPGRDAAGRRLRQQLVRRRDRRPPVALDHRDAGKFLAGTHPVRLRPFVVLAFAEGERTLRAFDLADGTFHAHYCRARDAE